MGLIPENELSKSANVDICSTTNGAVFGQDRQTSVSGIFACGNVLHVHNLVDFVSEEAEIAGQAAAEYIMGFHAEPLEIMIKTDGKIRYTVPQRITKKKDIIVYFRASNIYKNVRLTVTSGDVVLLSKKAEGCSGRDGISDYKSCTARKCKTIEFFFGGAVKWKENLPVSSAL